jgi:hypothetical protein
MKLLIKPIWYVLLSVVVLGSLGLVACDPEKPEPPSEASLVISLDPNPSGRVTSLGATYDFAVKVDSQMPTQGVSVNVVYKKDSDNSVVFSREYATTTSPLSVQVTNIPYNEVGTVTVVVTSKTKSDNTQTKTFQLVRK